MQPPSTSTRWNLSTALIRHLEHLLQSHEVCGPCSVAFLDQTTKFERCMIRCGSKNGHHKSMCLANIGLNAQNLLTIPGSIVNIIGRPIYGHLMTSRIFTLIIIRYSHKLQN